MTANTPPRRLAGARVLLGEPREPLRADTAALLTDHGADVHAVGGLDALVDQARRWHPSVVVTADDYPPGTSVLTVTPTLRAVTPPPVLIVVTGDPDPIRHRLYITHGNANWVMVKGADSAEDLVAEVAIAQETYQLYRSRRSPSSWDSSRRS